MTGVTVLFGIGAAKAGTTWLHRMLSGHPDCYFRSIKEVHYFDTLDRSGAKWRARKPAQKLAALDKRRGAVRSDRVRRKDLRDWQAMLARDDASHQTYLAYLLDGSDRSRVVGDITPSYALLDEAGFAEMAALVPDTRFIYLLRDPLDRLWSNIRMSAFRQTGGGAEFATRANQLLDAFVAGLHPAADQRCDYVATLKRLTAAVAPERIFLGYFEELFTQNSLTRITGFLGLAPMMVRADDKVLQGHDLGLDIERRKRALDRLRPQYDTVSQFLTRPVPARWQAQSSGG